MRKKSNWDVRKLVGLALFTAIVVVLQLLGSFIKFGPFSISLVLIPIAVGAALYGTAAGGYLGGVFGLVVLISGDAAAFMTISVPATILVVMLKGICAGLVSGLIYNVLRKKNEILAVFLAAIAAPIVNTGIFVLGCFAFFLKGIAQWDVGNAAKYVIFGMVGLNFIVEFAINVLLSNVVYRLNNIRRNTER